MQMYRDRTRNNLLTVSPGIARERQRMAYWRFSATSLRVFPTSFRESMVRFVFLGAYRPNIVSSSFAQVLDDVAIRSIRVEKKQKRGKQTYLYLRVPEIFVELSKF